MKKINVLLGNEVINKNILLSYWSILLENKENLKKKNILINFYYSLGENFLDGDVLIISSRFFFKKDNENTPSIILRLKKINKVNSNILWFDLRDSAGTTQFEVIPYVKKYFKGQLYKDKQMYTQDFYGGRFYTNFYHHKYDVIDHEKYYQKTIDSASISKLCLSWNIGALRYDLRYYNFIKKYFYSFVLKNHVIKNDFIKYIKPENFEKRHHRVNAIYNKEFLRESVAFQRQLAFKKLNNKNKFDLVNSNLNIKKYIESIKNSKVVLSLYGWGEICYRDWESIIFGTPFIKPDMSNIVTWPNIYIPYKTYYPVKLSLDNLEDTINLATNSQNESLLMVKKCQEIHKSIRSNKGLEFCNRFISMINLK